jgi:hypothetical protein
MIANRILRDKEAENNFVNITRTPRRHGGDAVSMSDSTEADGSAATSGLNIKELALEIVKNIQRESEAQPGAVRSTQNLKGVPQGPPGEASRNFAVLRNVDPNLRRNLPPSRQLPRPPNLHYSHETTHSADTLPAYKRSYVGE